MDGPIWLGRPAERGLAARRQQQHLIADVEVGEGVGDHQHHATGVGQLPQHRHDLPVQRGVQAGGGLVEDQQRRPGQQFERHRRALALPAGQLVDPGVEVLGHLELFENLGDDLFAVGLRGVRRQPQLGGVHQGLPDGELAVHHVVLRDHADSASQRGVFGVDVVAFEADRAGCRMGVTGDQSRERRLACTRRSDDGRQHARSRGQRDVVQQCLVALDGPRDAVHFEAAGRGSRPRSRCGGPACRRRRRGRRCRS